MNDNTSEYCADEVILFGPSGEIADDSVGWLEDENHITPQTVSLDHCFTANAPQRKDETTEYCSAASNDAHLLKEPEQKGHKGEFAVLSFSG